MRIRLAPSTALRSLALLFAALLIAVPAWAQKPPIKIGFLAPLTGGAAQIGRDMVNGFEMYLDEAGHQIQNTVIDTYLAVVQFWTYKPEEFLKQPLYTRDWPPCRGC